MRREHKGRGGAGKGARATLPLWQQWEKVGDIARPATHSASQCFAPQKWQTAFIQPNDSGQSELEYRHRAAGNRGRAWEGAGKKWDRIENIAFVPGADGTDGA